ncbi:MAG TPA: isocitrate lyase/phosphoenolpyruvate mutase family protein [Galbitalea sp.]|jgi:2-methylisocitrate lyase-like PEP mutase family enzyme|nr:isocitrate lyase/phosphoenolpyruvate mutase family protein [Galbitalea sp.]
MTTQAQKAELLRSLHVPGDPLIVTNVWDAVTARIVAGVPGVRAIASASHSVSFAHGVPDSEGLTVDEALAVAQLIVGAVDLPVTVDFEKAYARDATGVETNVGRLIETGAVGLNLEDSIDGTGLFPIEVAAGRVAAARRAADGNGVPIVINARVDALIRGSDWADMVARANAYLAAGADCAFVLGLSSEEDVARALDAVNGKVSVIAGATSVPLKRLAELGVSRVSFGPRMLGLTLSHLREAAEQLTARGEYPPELDFEY